MINDLLIHSYVESLVMFILIAISTSYLVFNGYPWKEKGPFINPIMCVRLPSENWIAPAFFGWWCYHFWDLSKFEETILEMHARGACLST